MAVSQTVSVPANSTTLIVTGDGSKVLLQAVDVFLGDSLVDYTTGVFNSSEILDLGQVSTGEEIYAYSFNATTVIALFYSVV